MRRSENSMVLKRKSLVIGILMFLLIMTGYLNFRYNNNVADYRDSENLALDSKNQIS